MWLGEILILLLFCVGPAYVYARLTAVSREAWATLPESSSQPLPATLAQTRNLAHASLETAVQAKAVRGNAQFCKY